MPTTNSNRNRSTMQTARNPRTRNRPEKGASGNPYETTYADAEISVNEGKSAPSLPAQKAGRQKEENRMPLPDLTIPPLELVKGGAGRCGALRGLARPKGGKIRKSEEVIAALMAGRSMRQAAEDCGIGYRTLKEWFASPWFQAEYSTAKKQLLDATINQLRTIGSEAVSGLYDVVTNVANPASARVSAARAILEVLLRAIEVQDISERLARLEELTTKGEEQ
jgi:hypothetical protein